MFNEIDVLETEIEALKTFNVEFPKESASATKRAAKMAAKLLDDIDSDNVTFVTSQKSDDDDNFDFIPNDFGVGLTKGLDFYNLDKENSEWIGVPIILATDEDFLFSNFFMGGEQNENLRNYRNSKKEQVGFEDDEDDED